MSLTAIGLRPAMVSCWPPTLNLLRLSPQPPPTFPPTGHIRCVELCHSKKMPSCWLVSGQHENWAHWPLFALAEKIASMLCSIIFRVSHCMDLSKIVIFLSRVSDHTTLRMSPLWRPARAHFSITRQEWQMDGLNNIPYLNLVCHSMSRSAAFL